MMTREEREDVINFFKGYIDEEVYTEKCRNAHEADIYCSQYCENPYTAATVKKMALEIDKYTAEKE